MQKRFLTVIKSKYIKSPLPDYFFEIYKLRKRANDEHSPLTTTEKKEYMKYTKKYLPIIQKFKKSSKKRLLVTFQK
ncbi:hypothetical protein IGL28_000128 [Enterococcus sp. AZ077]